MKESKQKHKRVKKSKEEKKKKEKKETRKKPQKCKTSEDFVLQPKQMVSCLHFGPVEGNRRAGKQVVFCHLAGLPIRDYYSRQIEASILRRDLSGQLRVLLGTNG